MESPKKTARLAGFLYLILVISGIFSLGYVPSQVVDWENPATTINNITASEGLFRLGIFSGIVCYTAFLLLPLALYTLFQHVNKAHAAAMVALSVASVPISLYNIGHQLNALTLVSQQSYLKSITMENLEAQVMLQLDYYHNGVTIASLFWGLWLLPFGYLAIKSGYIPKILGILLIAGCFGYVVNFTGKVLFAHYREWGISGFISIPGTLGEIGTCLWLVIAGVKKSATVNIAAS